ncbi:hypothetical protein DFQ01_103326 [Paenibacillus cellulosilyticus]|uniref:Uncharacterized protein n=1 Tax=Paenibacillus cellulosilyticus TaxID=375489 RepID=A0A2V2YXP9_9BACL|nr:hypothetical protein [Paenibacillus cellulosilyticus]PWW06423.1 hypothetical protein DFQ01_103326 [Paenibacillus cellulosilyticus]QKS46231.1 hypothetical protein HUB94_18620 [Paenibacillus cellulosilyticus]
MSYRSIDFQVSMSNIPDKSITHSQSMHKPVTDQALAADSFTKQTDQARTRNAPLEKSDKASIRSGEERKQQGNSKQRGKRKSDGQDAGEHNPKPSDLHPYKGKQFDVSL